MIHYCILNLIKACSRSPIKFDDRMPQLRLSARAQSDLARIHFFLLLRKN